jgi:hypothetical protein
LAKKQQKVSKLDIIIKNRKLPILTLDARWHQLFPEDTKSTELKALEQRLNNLLKRQGKLINDIKEMKHAKSGLIKDIVVNMDIGNDILGKHKEKKLDRNKRLIQELSDKIKKSMDELSNIPFQIKEVNEELMAESARACLERFHSNKKDIAAIEQRIKEMRDELKVKILAKQDMETMNTGIYTYLHDILGADVMEIFEKEYGGK